ncbi:MAG: hypothetical protein FJ284_10280 [Planctomycetes bacterium]|nr:hypothetical protein [Planctomycetota bacterium]
MHHSDSHPQGPMNDTPTSPAQSVDGDADTGMPLPPIMRQWKSDISRGAAAADKASLRLFDWLNDHGQAARAEGELTRADLLAIDPDKLEMFLDDLRDLQEQAEYAVEAMEAVMAAVDEGDENDDESDEN